MPGSDLSPRTGNRQDVQRIQELIQRLADAEETIRALTSAEVDAVLDAETNSLVLLRDTQEALVESETRYRRLITNMSGVVFELSPEGETLFVNEAVYPATGYSPEELIGKNWWDVFVPASERRRIAEFYEHILAADVRGFDLVLRGRNENTVHLELNTANLYSDEGELQRVIGFGINVTAKRQIEAELFANLQALQAAEEELRLQNEALIQAQENSIHERTQYRQLFQFAPDGYLVTSSNGLIQEANQAATRLLGASRENLVGKYLATFVKKDQRQAFNQLLSEIRSDDRRREWETFISTPRGQVVPVSLAAAPVFAEDTAGVRQARLRTTGIRWLVRDISRRIATEQELRQKNELVQLLSDIAIAANQATNVDEALLFAIERFCSYNDYPVGHALIRHPTEPGVLVSSGLWSVQEPQKYAALMEKTAQLQFRAGVEPPGTVMKNAEPAWLDIAAASLFRRREETEAAGLKGYIAFPILMAEQVNAVLEFFSEGNAPPDESTRIVMAQVGNQLGRVLERKAAERALRQSENRFRAIFNASVTGILQADLQGRIINANPALQAMLAYEPGELAGIAITGLVAAPERPAKQAGFHSLISGDQDVLRSESRYRTRTGEQIWVREGFSLVRDDQGAPLYLIGMLENITEQRQMANELAEVQRRLIDSAEAERLRLAQELHDGPMQDLYGAVFTLESLRSLLESAGDADQVENLKESLQQVVRELRVIAGELRPPALAPFGLEKAIRSYVDTFRQNYPGIQVHLDLASDGQTLSERMRLALFRIFQQSLSNVVQHANAQNVYVELALNQNRLILTVRDDGRGFTVPRRWISLAREGHLGLVGASERAEAVGGALSINSAPGAGTEIQVAAPLPNNLPKAENHDRT